MKKIITLSILIAVFTSCSEENNHKAKTGGFTNGATTLFTKISPDKSGIQFTNRIIQDHNFNFMNYMYIYTGAGVAVGDVDNDGLQDIYFTSNFGPNKLYRNKGDFEFEDITISSKTEDFKGFTSAVTMLDVNSDGWLDLYISKAGSLNDNEARRNLLYVNQQDGTFSEDAKRWGIDDPGYTTQAYSLDYDKDGDLDLYVVNHRYDFHNNGKINSAIQRQIEEVTSDQLYRNDGNRFTKVTNEAGLYNKAWGLAASIGDFNNDGWDDIYLANDFLEPDALYINQKNGTFKNEVLNRLNHITTNSMGTDFADLNNDLYNDLITLDMVSESHVRSKENMASMSTSNFMNMVKIGYHHSYMANMLHYNVGNGKFQETGQLSGISKTDWSWAPLIADFDNDGNKDIFVTNGVDRDYTNQDARRILKGVMERGESMSLENLLNTFPSEKMSNYIFKNNGDLTFEKKIEDWGLDDPGFSYGAAYADLDNDGDLDLITNNIDDPAGIYRNNSNNNYVQVELKGPNNNPFGIGSNIYLIDNNITQYQQLYLARGYKSSVTNVLNFGISNSEKINYLYVVWPDGKTSTIKNAKINEKIFVDYATANNESTQLAKNNSYKITIDPSSLGIDYIHLENDLNDYSIQLLIPQKQSTKGTGIAIADVNGDGLEDFFVGNATGSQAALYIQNKDGSFISTNKRVWSNDALYEDANALFFDSDGDGDQDLYVVSAGYELEEDDPLLQDRLYNNDGNGNFSRNNKALPVMLTSGKAVVSADYDKDGDMDLFVGGNLIPRKYPLPARSYLLKNEGGIFVDDTSNSMALSEIGMVSEAIFTDYDLDDDLDLMTVGEWMAPALFTNHDGSFEKNDYITGLEKTSGWWFSITAADFDDDGDEDYVMGNIGGNNKFHPSEKKPLFIYSKDFDENESYDVAMSKISNGKVVPVRGKECSSEQNPFLLDKIQTYKEFAHMEFNDIYGEDRLKDAFKLTSYKFKSAYVENLGNGDFKDFDLVNEAQTGPTLSTLATDINNDGNMDIIGIGAIYDAEVETIRYDSNYGYVLLGDGKGSFEYTKEYDPFIDSDSKDIDRIIINDREHFLVASNNSPIQLFTYEP
jgi:hypothetical protein